MIDFAARSDFTIFGKKKVETYLRALNRPRPC